MFKKFLCSLLVAVAAVSMVACSGASNNDTTKATTESTTEAAYESYSQGSTSSTVSAKWEKFAISKETAEEIIKQVDGKDFATGDTLDLSGIITDDFDDAIKKALTVMLGTSISVDDATKVVTFNSNTKVEYTTTDEMLSVTISTSTN